jgi:primosomal protein N' (replication factor Y) (superfamily II helicase)
VIEPEPALVVATRGAEPRVPGGYRAVLLLDGRRMLARESLLVAEDCLRWWSNAAALAAPGAPVHLVGVQGDVAVALAAWNSPGFADRQLADRRALRFPPAVRLAQLTGMPALVDELVEELGTVGAEALVRTQEGGEARVVVRFDYAAGHQVAATAKAAVMRRGPRRRPAGPGRPPPTLKVRFDVPEP